MLEQGIVNALRLKGQTIQFALEPKPDFVLGLTPGDKLNSMNKLNVSNRGDPYRIVDLGHSFTDVTIFVSHCSSSVFRHSTQLVVSVMQQLRGSVSSPNELQQALHFRRTLSLATLLESKFLEFLGSLAL